MAKWEYKTSFVNYSEVEKELNASSKEDWILFKADAIFDLHKLSYALIYRRRIRYDISGNKEDICFNF